MKHILIALTFIAATFTVNAKTVNFHTSRGDFQVQLNCEKAPLTCKNFLRYVKDNAYDQTIFHRVIKNFMIQGGGYNTAGKHLTEHAPIANESNNGLSNKIGTIAMARTQAPDSATRQFFINVHDNDFLDGHADHPGYAVFGHVTQGMNVVMAISKTPTHFDSQLGMGDVPVKQVVIESVKVINP